MSGLEKLQNFSNEFISKHGVGLEAKYENNDSSVLNLFSGFFNHSCYSDIDCINLGGPRIAVYSTKQKKDEWFCCSYGPTVKRKKKQENF